MPSAADIEALQEAKPEYLPEYLRDSKLNDRYNSDVESWGERLGSTGVRLCHWYNDRGADFKCRETKDAPKEGKK